MLLYFTGTGNCLYAAKRRLRPLIFFSSMMFAPLHSDLAYFS